ncbi:A24 family peptidase [Ructibacterium gallinarum]|uniref:Prepilin type IV endopeptidase peptidase domain-containing protein n=1 Tax=Ructibacterium gallinarum TaxID=2779355 RepID=A0A9D5M170_9FIRM|nr:hypothetical protein [Ructibacterium gallinarum]MBE5040747.1 hypothetical protein [Ructibacterium gallinarum]
MVSVKVIFFMLGAALGILLCWLLHAEEINLNKRQRRFHFAASGIYMGSAFLCACCYMPSEGYIEVIPVFAGLIFLALYAIQDMQEMAVYAAFLHLGILEVALLRIFGYLVVYDFSALCMFILSSIAVYVIMKILAKKRPNMIGDGDYDILFIVYMLCGYSGIVQAVFLSSVIGLIIYAPQLLLKRLDKHRKIPLAPILYLGTLAYFWL